MKPYTVLGPLRLTTLQSCQAQPSHRIVQGEILLGVAFCAALSVLEPISASASTVVHAYAYANSVNVAPLTAYVHYIINIIRVVTGVFVGLAVTYLGAAQAMSLEGNAAAATKRYLQNVVWACLLVFCGAQLADFFVARIPGV